MPTDDASQRRKERQRGAPSVLRGARWAVLMTPPFGDVAYSLDAPWYCKWWCSALREPTPPCSEVAATNLDKGLRPAVLRPRSAGLALSDYFLQYVRSAQRTGCS